MLPFTIKGSALGLKLGTTPLAILAAVTLPSVILAVVTALSFILAVVTASAPSFAVVTEPSLGEVNNPTPKCFIPLHTELAEGVKSKVTVEPETV